MEKTIAASTEARVILTADAGLAQLFQDYLHNLRELFIVSQVELRREIVEVNQVDQVSVFDTLSAGRYKVSVQKADGTKCERCWNYSTRVRENARYPTVCERCTEALAEIESDTSANVAAT